MGISIKGIIAGMVFGFVMSLMAGFVVGVAAVAALGSAGPASIFGTEPGRMTAPLFVISALVAVAAGYVAAWIAGRGELVNAALANLVGSAIGLVVGIALSPDALVDGLIWLVAAPMFGLLGGYLRLRRVRGTE